MKNKKKKGFTLIEILAIIVILAIIAVITVPIILNVIENSRKGAASDSAYGYKDAVNKAYVETLQTHNDFMLDDTYTVSSTGLSNGDFGDSEVTSLPINISGDKPTSGELTYENNVLKSGWLVIGDYRVTFNSDGTITTEKNTGSSSNEQGGNTPTQSIIKLYDSTKTVEKNIDTIAVGDMATIGDQGFEVINTNNNGNVVLLAEYNLKEQEDNSTFGYNQQNSGIMLMSNRTYLADNNLVWKQYSGNDYFTTNFSDKVYWYGITNGCTVSEESSCTPEYGYLQSYYSYSQVKKYIYRTSDGKDTDNRIYPIINAYKTYLQGLGQNIADARLMSSEEVDSLTIEQRLANSQSYWLGSEGNHGADEVYCSCFVGYLSNSSCSNEHGIRPVIEISTSDF